MPLLEELRKLLDRQDQLVDDTFDVLNAAYERSIQDVVDAARAKIDNVQTDIDGHFKPDVEAVASTRVGIVESVSAAEAVWKRWDQRLRLIAGQSDAYFATAKGAKRASAIEQVMLDELIGLWPKRGRPASGTAGRFYQLATHHRQELANAVTRHVLGRTRPKELVKDLAEKTDRSVRQAEQMFRDSTIQVSRTVQANSAVENDFEYFQYYGPQDRITRPFCSPLVGRIFSRKEIEEMDNGQTGAGSVMVAGGGYNCRHHWMPVDRSWFSEEEWKAATNGEVAEPEPEPEADPVPDPAPPTFNVPEFDSVKEAEEFILSENLAGAVKLRRGWDTDGIRTAVATVHDVTERFGMDPVRYIGDQNYYNASVRELGQPKVVGANNPSTVAAYGADSLFVKNKTFTHREVDDPAYGKLTAGVLAIADMTFSKAAAARLHQLAANGWTMRFAISNDVERVIQHELGHRWHLDFSDLDFRRSIRKHYQEGWAAPIGVYASSKEVEFAAESMVAYLQGEWHLLPDDLIEQYALHDKRADAALALAKEKGNR